MGFFLDTFDSDSYKNMSMNTNAIIDPEPPAGTSQIGQ